MFLSTFDQSNLIFEGSKLLTSDLTQLSGSVSVAGQLDFPAFLRISPKNHFPAFYLSTIPKCHVWKYLSNVPSVTAPPPPCRRLACAATVSRAAADQKSADFKLLHSFTDSQASFTLPPPCLLSPLLRSVLSARRLRPAGCCCCCCWTERAARRRGRCCPLLSFAAPSSPLLPPPLPIPRRAATSLHASCSCSHHAVLSQPCPILLTLPPNPYGDLCL